MVTDVDAILNEVLDSIQAGAGTAHKVQDAAKDVFRRRYRGSFQHRLDQGGDWDNEKYVPLRVATEHGIIAAAIARLNDTDEIDDVIMMKAARIAEVECHFAAVARVVGRTPKPRSETLGQWCW